jgi:hypothetical protein
MAQGYKYMYSIIITCTVYFNIYYLDKIGSVIDTTKSETKSGIDTGILLTI